MTPCIASSSQFSNRHGVGSVEDDNQCIRFGLGVSELGEHWQQKRCEEMGLIDLLLRQRRMKTNLSERCRDTIENTDNYTSTPI